MNIREDFCKLLGDVREWHEKTFPDAKLNNQLLKLEEELEELEQASTFLEKELKKLKYLGKSKMEFGNLFKTENE